MVVHCLITACSALFLHLDCVPNTGRYNQRVTNLQYYSIIVYARLLSVIHQVILSSLAQPKLVNFKP